VSASSTYLRWLGIFFGLPLAVLWATHFRLLWSQRRAILWCALWALLIGVPWDWWAIRMDAWSFPHETHLGSSIAGWPLEELVFTVCAATFVSSFTLVLGGRAERRPAAGPPL